MTEQRKAWYANPELSKTLSDVFEKPAVKLALKIWMDESYSRVHANANALVITQTGVALAGQITGYERAIKNLLSLASMEVVTDETLEETYGVDATKPTE